MRCEQGAELDGLQAGWALGAGVNAVPVADLSYRDLTKASLVGADLESEHFIYATLDSADLSQANLTYAIKGPR